MSCDRGKIPVLRGAKPLTLEAIAQSRERMGSLAAPAAPVEGVSQPTSSAVPHTTTNTGISPDGAITVGTSAGEMTQGGDSPGTAPDPTTPTTATIGINNNGQYEVTLHLFGRPVRLSPPVGPPSPGGLPPSAKCPSPPPAGKCAPAGQICTIPAVGGQGICRKLSETNCECQSICSSKSSCHNPGGNCLGGGKCKQSLNSNLCFCAKEIDPGPISSLLDFGDSSNRAQADFSEWKDSDIEDFNTYSDSSEKSFGGAGGGLDLPAGERRNPLNLGYQWILTEGSPYMHFLWNPAAAQDQLIGFRRDGVRFIFQLLSGIYRLSEIRGLFDNSTYFLYAPDGKVAAIRTDG
ncbi:MAG: hypothetical protein KDD70_16270, partial [Bdellovibrionales bacterium]|nr:hypothetical protein [Bdellovibrionales bacterium]